MHRRPGSLTAMPDDEQTEPAADERDDEATPEESDGPVISAYGIASAVLGALSVAAIARLSAGTISEGSSTRSPWQPKPRATSV